MSVRVETSLGEILIKLHTDRCPFTCKNFLGLCKMKYYNGCLFHTVQKDFLAQTGDPTGTGYGGDSVYRFMYGPEARYFGDEIHPDLKHSKKGTIGMTKEGENGNASQFYITLRDDFDTLDGKHTVFGEVTEGIETVDRINEARTDHKSRPYLNIRIKHTRVLEDPFSECRLQRRLIPDASPKGKPKDEVDDDDVRLEDNWEPMGEQLGALGLEAAFSEKEACSKAFLLESIRDLPTGDIKPPANVLFVCKLNPETEDGDLKNLFLQYGVVTSADIIRHTKTRDSLCYAFIEFQDTVSCEQACLKTHDVVLHDRKLHVDYSQNVSRLWNQTMREGNYDKRRDSRDDWKRCNENENENGGRHKRSKLQHPDSVTKE